MMVAILCCIPDMLPNEISPPFPSYRTYDGNGNRLSAKMNHRSYTFSYEANRLMKVSERWPVQSYRYDPNGNRLTNGSLTLAYNPESVSSI